MRYWWLTWVMCCVDLMNIKSRFRVIIFCIRNMPLVAGVHEDNIFIFGNPSGNECTAFDWIVNILYLYERTLHNLSCAAGAARVSFRVGAYQAYRVPGAHGNTAGGLVRVCSRTDQPNCYTSSVTTNIQQPLTVTSLLGELPVIVLMKMFVVLRLR